MHILSSKLIRHFNVIINTFYTTRIIRKKVNNEHNHLVSGYNGKKKQTEKQLAGQDFVQQTNFKLFLTLCVGINWTFEQ